MFDIKGKVALITGGAGGVGLELSKALLRNNLRGVALVDLNASLGEKAVLQIQSEFGQDKAIFFKADVTNIEQLEDAFKKTVEHYHYLDIVFNNAGILNDAIWEKEISINVKGAVNVMLLAYETYLPSYKSGAEGLIVNTSSIAGIQPSGHLPIYCSTKHAVIGLTRSWGEPVFYNKNKVRVVAMCPGVTHTPLISEIDGKSLGGIYEDCKSEVATWPTQDPDVLARQAMEVVKYAPHGSIWVIEGGEPAYQYIHPDKSSMKHNVISRYYN
ncbi:15-hydroxyprostaglandin dehydrogenase [NAD(+)] isoform X1 [Diabrotica virgifera virgifera]|uniref:15-hydroxyprostaglandin dehydrogenase [NAD(+)]-like n=1 Tax=Diabrotica virgifera virgifera TaxID=50390 RepID=A0ABM5IJT3_DIAVI|nr:15-hydroxyprostaglandin dehydrogenase [NAD(+)] isoform X1 [Diabrotica virgifera virgifera]